MSYNSPYLRTTPASFKQLLLTKTSKARERNSQITQKKARGAGRFKMPQLFPSNPSATMVIRSVTPNIVTMSLPFARFGVWRFGGRGTLGKSFTLADEGGRIPLRGASMD